MSLQGCSQEGSDGLDEPLFQKQNFFKVENHTKSYSPELSGSYLHTGVALHYF